MAIPGRRHGSGSLVQGSAETVSVRAGNVAGWLAGRRAVVDGGMRTGESDHTCLVCGAVPEDLGNGRSNSTIDVKAMPACRSFPAQRYSHPKAPVVPQGRLPRRVGAGGGPIGRRTVVGRGEAGRRRSEPERDLPAPAWERAAHRKPLLRSPVLVGPPLDRAAIASRTSAGHRQDTAGARKGARTGLSDMYVRRAIDAVVAACERRTAPPSSCPPGIPTPRVDFLPP